MPGLKRNYYALLACIMNNKLSVGKAVTAFKIPTEEVDIAEGIRK